MAYSSLDVENRVNYKFHFFISYESEYKSVVSQVYESLVGLKYSVWFDQEQIYVGQNLHEKLAEGILQSKYFLCFLSKKYAKSYNCKLEYKFALQNKKDAIFVVLEKYNIPLDLSMLMANSVRLDAYKDKEVATTGMSKKAIETLIVSISKLNISRDLSSNSEQVDEKTKSTTAEKVEDKEGEDEERIKVVIANGSSMIQAGFSGDDTPTAAFRNIIGEIKKRGKTETLIGDEAGAQVEFSRLRYPVEKGIITNWDDIKAVWQYTISKVLKVKPEQQPVIVIESSKNTKENRKKMADVLFELNVPAILIGNQSLFSLYASGSITGIVLYSGGGCTEVVPVYEGYAIRSAIITLDYAGRNITEYLKKLLMEKGYKYLEDMSELVEIIKEKLGYVVLDYEKDLKKFCVHKNYELGGGQVITLSKEAFKCTEAIFNPTLMGCNSIGIVTALNSSIMKCDENIRKDLYANVVLSGGNTMFPGFVDRLEAEFKALLPETCVVKVVAPPERKHSAWIGGSIIGYLESINDKLVYKKEYEQHGSDYMEKIINDTFFQE